MSSDNKSIVMPTFSGKDEDFQVWWTKFKAFATAKGCVSALLGRDADLPDTYDEELDESDSDDMKKIKARIRNDLAMAYLLNAFKSEADISCAYESMDDDWPGGLAYKVVESLLDIYKPEDTVTEVELYAKLLTVKMKKTDNPRILFEQVASIQNWYNNESRKLPLSQMIAVILKAAPDAYASVLTSEQTKMGDNLKLSHLRKAMNTYYRSVYKEKGKEKDEKTEEELKLANQDQNNKKKKKFRGDCHNCGQSGHMAKDCWHDPKNASKRPPWFKAKEVAAAAKSEELQLVTFSWSDYAEAFAEEDEEDETIEAEVLNLQHKKSYVEAVKTEKCERKMTEKVSSTSETLLRIARTGTSLSLLEDPDVFVLDTGATCHSTGHENGMINLKSANGSKTRVGNGESVATKAVGDLPFEAVNNGVKGKWGAFI